ncbi:MAG: DUF1549 and DUF1553 domain-containing protein, partial [Verrucomicrobiota bacterium]
LARYADSNGFQADQLRDSWAYRDWVIKALNDDMPFDRFTLEQLAGDLLPEPTLDQKIATGFHRTPTCNVEAGVHPEENRVNQVVDRVNVTATVWLGATMECAQCHDHKYDPITMKEYYRLFAFFNNTPVEVTNRTGKGVSYDFYGPRMDLPLTAEQATKKATLEAELKALEQISDPDELKREQAAWEERIRASLDTRPTWHVLEAASVESTGRETFEHLDDQSVLVGGEVPNQSTYTVRLNHGLKDITGFKIETLTHESLPGKGPGRGDAKRPNFILSELTVTSDGEAVELHSPKADFSQPKWEVNLAIDGDLKKGWAVGGKGGFHEDHWATFLSRKPVNGKSLTFTITQNYGRGRTIGRFRISVMTGDPAAESLPDEIAALFAKEKRTGKDQKKIDQHFAGLNSPATKNKKRIDGLKKRIKDIKPHSTLIMVEKNKPRDTHVMMRGDYLTPGEQVEFGTPAVLHDWKEAYPQNRVGLARWLMDKDNPLVARVTVNRWWSQLFGRGIVATEEDFGSQAEPPTHPKLLDWLAVEFMESGWSMKHMLKQMVLSG